MRTKTFHGGRSISLLGTAGQNKQAYFFPGADKTGGWPTLASRWFHGLSRLRLPHLSRSSTGGHRVVRVHVHSSERSSGHECYMPLCPHGCNRYYGAGYLHFITTSGYQRRALLGRPQNHDVFLQVLEQVRRRHWFAFVQGGPSSQDPQPRVTSNLVMQ